MRPTHPPASHTPASAIQPLTSCLVCEHIVTFRTRIKLTGAITLAMYCSRLHNCLVLLTQPRLLWLFFFFNFGSCHVDQATLVSLCTTSWAHVFATVLWHTSSLSQSQRAMHRT